MQDFTPMVFIVDDDPSTRDTVEALVLGAGLRPRCFETAAQFLAHPRVTVPSCVVLDVKLPDLNGLELQSRVAAESNEMPVIFLTGCRDVPTTVQAMKAGAFEFLTKPCDAHKLSRIVTDAIEQSRVALARQAGRHVLRARLLSLTLRERQVLNLVAAGRRNKEVANELGISEITVKVYRGRVMRKMQAKSFAQLIRDVRGVTSG